MDAAAADPLDIAAVRLRDHVLPAGEPAGCRAAIEVLATDDHSP